MDYWKNLLEQIKKTKKQCFSNNCKNSSNRIWNKKICPSCKRKINWATKILSTLYPNAITRNTKTV